jgi:hypothetical protein
VVHRLWGLASDAGPHNGCSSETRRAVAKNMRRFIVLAGVVMVVLPACGGSAGNKTNTSPSNATSATSFSVKEPQTPPAGIDPADWHQFCIDGSALADALRVIQAGHVSTSYAATRLAIVQADIHEDSLAAEVRSADIAGKMQAVSDAIGRAERAIGTATTPDWNALVTASQALPRCS